MQSELEKLRQLTKALTSNGYLTDQTIAWKFAFNAVDELICITNQDLKLKFMNREILGRLDIHDNSYLNKQLSSFLNKSTDILKKSSSALSDTLFYGECYIETLNGWFDVRRHRIKDNLHKHIGYIFILVDVTEKIAIKQTLEDSNNLLLGVLDAIPEILYVQDKNYNVLLSNYTAKKLLGDNLIKNRKCYELLNKISNCDNCSATKCKTSKVPEKTHRYIDILEGQYECMAYPVLDDDGEVTKVIVHLRKITKENC